MLKNAVRTVLVWVLLAGAAGYAFAPGGPLAHLLVKPAPNSAISTPAARPAARVAANESRFRRAGDGHFYVDADVNGTRIHFLVDTGASLVVLSPADARAAGIRPGQQDFTGRASTANGIARVAPVTLREIGVQQLSFYDVPASVMEQPMPVSLLGMSFLSRLQGYETRDDELVLRW